MSTTMFTELFIDTVDVIFSFHGYPGAIHHLVHGRPDTDRFRVRSFIEQGTTTTPFDMTVRNKRYRLGHADPRASTHGVCPVRDGSRRSDLPRRTGP